MTKKRGKGCIEEESNKERPVIRIAGTDSKVVQANTSLMIELKISRAEEKKEKPRTALAVWRSQKLK